MSTCLRKLGPVPEPNKETRVPPSRILTLSFIIISLTLGPAGCGKAPPPVKPGGLRVGDRAADFALVDQTGKMVRFSDVQPGWYLVLFFYRGHWCGTCRGQLLSLKDDFSKFAPLHATVAAVSTDPMEESADFNAEWRFPFPLLSDTQLQLIDAYGLRQDQGHEGRDISRVGVVIIDPQKTVRYKFAGQEPTDRPTDEEILFTLQQIEKVAVKQ
jgi:thioredoxin-dependent peroxiredoxin